MKRIGFITFYFKDTDFMCHFPSEIQFCQRFLIDFFCKWVDLIEFFRPQLKWQALNEDATWHLGNKSDQRKLIIALVPCAKAFKDYNGKWEMAATAY